MINSELLIRYTTALYRCPPENSPTYTEFRDMFSEGQLRSKFWLVDELKKSKLPFRNLIIVGSWFATLAFFIAQEFSEVKIKCLDIDPRCAEFFKALTDYTDARFRMEAATGDLKNYTYTEDLVINTSCEHLTQMNSWLQSIPSKTVIVLQSSNLAGHDQHINCVNSKAEFEDHVSPFVDIKFAGELKLDMYSRFMIIGTKK
jgi:hypothetical protein